MNEGGAGPPRPPPARGGGELNLGPAPPPLAGGGRGRGPTNPPSPLLRGRVFPANLRRRRVEALLLPIQPRLARPPPFQFVTHLEAELAEAAAFQLDRVAVHEAGQTTVIGAGGEDVARLQRMDRR